MSKRSSKEVSNSVSTPLIYRLIGFSPELWRELRKELGSRGVSKFVREAVASAVRRARDEANPVSLTSSTGLASLTSQKRAVGTRTRVMDAEACKAVARAVSELERELARIAGALNDTASALDRDDPSEKDGGIHPAHAANRLRKLARELGGE